LGFRVTLKCKIFRRSWPITKKQYRTPNVSVGTVKKSIAAMASRWFLHPHVHCVVPAGGLSADRTRWIKLRYDFFLPVKVLGRVFRGKFVAALQRAFRDGKLSFHGNLKLLAQPKTFAAWRRLLFRKD
jgi:Putative transposase